MIQSRPCVLTPAGLEMLPELWQVFLGRLGWRKRKYHRQRELSFAARRPRPI